MCREEWILQGLEQAGQVVLKYAAGADDDGRAANPNGSQGDVAGLCDATRPRPRPDAASRSATSCRRSTRAGRAWAWRPEGEGLALFRNAVRFFTDNA